MYFERYEFSASFGDGSSYGLYSWCYDGNSLYENDSPIEAEGSDGLIEGLLAMNTDYVEEYFEEENFLLNQYIEEIHNMGFNPPELGFDSPICDTTDSVEKILRIERTDDSEIWERDYDSPYMFVLDSDGYLGHIFIDFIDFKNRSVLMTDSEGTNEKTNRNKNTDENNYRALYRNVLENYHAEDEYYTPRFSLIYINDDEIPELAIVEGFAHVYGVSVYTVYDGKVVEIGIYGSNGEMEYLEKGNIIHSNWSGMGAAIDDYYSIDAGNESRICSLNSEENYPNVEEHTYSIDGNDVSEEEYNRRLRGMQRNYSLCSFDNMYEINEDMINLYL